ncbi:MAG TPA: zf-HC2 domain-containing protein [Acidimicrobiales bacterium]|nr:zf-HC2 domain-containing protein [Acidimicrobiales bacterium]
MTASDHGRYRDLTAAYVLGALDAGERVEIEQHLEACEACRSDVVSFAPLPALLSRVDADDAASDHPGAGADALVAAVRADVDQLDRSRRRWRRGAGLAAAAALVLAAFVVVRDDDPARWSDGVELAVEAISAETTADVVATERGWGTYLSLSAEGLPPRDAYEMWTVDDEGAWEPVGSWGPTPEGRADLGCSSALPLGAIDRVVVTSDDRGDELLVAR